MMVMFAQLCEYTTTEIVRFKRLNAQLKKEMGVHTPWCFFVTRWTPAHQAPLSMGFSRQEYWTGMPFPSPGDLPDPGIKPTSLYISSTGRWVLYHHLPPGKPVSVIIAKRYKDVRIQKSFSVVALSTFPASLPSSTPPHLTFSFRDPLRKILP